MTDTSKAPIQRVVDLGPCNTCGQIHTRCASHTKATSPERAERRGQPCGAAAMVGQTVCAQHGGKAPQNRAAATRRITRQRAIGEVGALMAEALGVIEPLSGTEQLVMAINHAGAMALSYRWLLEELPERTQWSWTRPNSITPDDGPTLQVGPPTRWVVIESEGRIGPDQHGNQQLHAYEEGFRHWTALHGKLLKTAADIGLEERRQRFAEDQVRTIGTAIRAIVHGLGRELDDPTVVPVVEAALAVIARDGTSP